MGATVTHLWTAADRLLTAVMSGALPLTLLAVAVGV